MSGRSTRDQLIDRLRSVWPAPIPIGVSRVPRRHTSRSEEYLVLPTRGRPVFLVPADSAGAAGALVRSDDGQRAPVLARALAASHRLGLLKHTPGVTRVAVPCAEGLVPIVHRLVPEATPSSSDWAAAGTAGRSCSRRSTPRAARSRSPSVPVVRASGGSRAERDRLHELADRPVPGITPPPVLGWVIDDDAAVLCIGALRRARRPPPRGFR